MLFLILPNQINFHCLVPQHDQHNTQDYTCSNPPLDHAVQADVNVSLTSISLLWNASDLLGKLYSKARSRSSSRSSLEVEPDTNGNTGSPGAQLDSDQYQELVRLLYGALQVSCCHKAPLGVRGGRGGGGCNRGVKDLGRWELVCPQLGYELVCFLCGMVLNVQSSQLKVALSEETLLLSDQMSGDCMPAVWYIVGEL